MHTPEGIAMPKFRMQLQLANSSKNIPENRMLYRGMNPKVGLGG